MNENYNDCHYRKTTRTLIYTKSKKIAKHFIMQKARHFSKSQTISVTFYIKKRYTLSHVIFHEIFEVGIYIQKHETLRYVTFLYSKSQTLRKKQDNLRYVFIYKNPALLSYCKYEIPDHKVGIYCNVIGPLAALRHMHFRAKRF